VSPSLPPNSPKSAPQAWGIASQTQSFATAWDKNGGAKRLDLSGLSAVFNGGFHKGRSPFGGGMGVPPTSLPIPQVRTPSLGHSFADAELCDCVGQEWGAKRLSLSGLFAVFNGGFHKGRSPFGGAWGCPQPPSQSPQVRTPSLGHSFADAELCDCVGQEWGDRGVERAIFVRMTSFSGVPAAPPGCWGAGWTWSQRACPEALDP